jgi:hypothetical protein
MVVEVEPETGIGDDQLAIVREGIAEAFLLLADGDAVMPLR